MRTEYRTPIPTLDVPLLFSVATKRVTISGQRFDLYKRISVSRCLATDTSVVLPTFRRHVIILISIHSLHSFLHLNIKTVFYNFYTAFLKVSNYATAAFMKSKG
jgi:hypothetical protein